MPPRRIATALALTLAGCAAHEEFRPVADIPVKIGRPYTVRGMVFVPAADAAYDMLGYASWYDEGSGKRTANGERFRADWITAAHPTLPLPSYVEVTALDTGRRIVVRVNDRGPFAGGARILDLSRGAAELLGMRAQGRAAVRVRRIEPREADRARLRSGQPAAPLSRVPEATLRNLRDQLARAGF